MMEFSNQLWKKLFPLLKRGFFRFIDSVGLADIGEFLREPDDEFTSDDKETLQKYRDKVKLIKGNELKEIINDLNRRAEDEEERKNILESKALSLLGFTGIALTLILGLLSIPISEDNSLSLKCFVALLTLAGISLLLTAIFSLSVTMVGRYKFAEPDIENLLAFAENDADNVWQEQAYDMLWSYLKNRILINHKAGFVIGSQKWFRNAVVFLLVGLLVLVLNFLFVGKVITSESPTQPSIPSATTQAPTLTLTLIPSPSFTPSPTQSNTPLPTITTSIVP